MPEVVQNTASPEQLITAEQAREKLDQNFAAISAYNSSDSTEETPVPRVDGSVLDFVSSTEPVPTDILIDYANQMKFMGDAMSKRGDNGLNYWISIAHISRIDAGNLQSLYEAEAADGALHTMLAWQVADKEIGVPFVRPALAVLKKIHEAETVPELTHSHPDDPTLAVLTDALQSGTREIYDFYEADTSHKFKPGSQERRVWMRDAVIMATGIADPEQADAYIYAMSRATMGHYSLNILVDRIRSYGPEKLKAIQDFAGISALASYSDEQLDRMLKLAQADKQEVERLKVHDVNVMLIDMEGDHNGVAAEVAERLDDDAGRTLFFEITRPDQVYGYLKKLHGLGISPSTLIFASHGSAGQFFISERPQLDSQQLTEHITLVIDQELADKQASANPSDKVKGYDISRANGLIRSIQRFMQPSRAIDDADQDLGRKKIISLSCQFDAEAPRGRLGPDGEVIREGKTTLLQRLGEVLVDKLANEHIDIYGADISTNKQTPTPDGFFFNQMIDGVLAPYPASVLHIDGQDVLWQKVDEVQLRKGSSKS